MSGYKIDRLSSDVQFQLYDIIRELKDPRVSQYMLSVVRVEITNDLSYAKIYIGAVEGFEAAKNAVKGLTGASGFIRRELGSRVKMRKVPELRFIADDSIEHSAHIAKILSDFEKDDKND